MAREEEVALDISEFSREFYYEDCLEFTDCILETQITLWVTARAWVLGGILYLAGPQC